VGHANLVSHMTYIYIRCACSDTTPPITFNQGQIVDVSLNLSHTLNILYTYSIHGLWNICKQTSSIICVSSS